jgi:hypothetical protein
MPVTGIWLLAWTNMPAWRRAADAVGAATPLAGWPWSRTTDDDDDPVPGGGTPSAAPLGEVVVDELHGDGTLSGSRRDALD